MLSNYLTVSLDKFSDEDLLEHQSNEMEEKSIRIIFPSYRSLTKDEIRSVLNACISLKGLESLKLIFLEGADIPFELIGSALKRPHQIVNLHVDCHSLTPDSVVGLQCFNESLCGHPSLKEFKLSFVRLNQGSTALDSIAKAVSTISSFEAVWIYVKPYPKGCSSGLSTESSDLLCRSENLIKLKLGGLKLSEEHVEMMSRALQADNTKLQEISMWSCDISSQGASNLAKMLRVNTSLKTLDLSWNARIGDMGCVALAEALEINSNLQSIFLHNTSIGKPSTEAFARMFQRNFTLKDLWARAGDEDTNKMISFYTALNKSGKRDILRDTNATQDKLVETLSLCKSDLSEIFYYVSKCPVLVVESAAIVQHNKPKHSEHGGTTNSREESRRELRARCA